MNTSRISLPAIDTEAEAADLAWQHYCTVAKTLDAGDIINQICDTIIGDIGETPIAALVEGWLDSPEPDWDRPLLGGYHAESIGRYIGAIAAKIMAREIDRAVERSRDVAF
jgi:hypothetical protein